MPLVRTPSAVTLARFATLALAFSVTACTDRTGASPAAYPVATATPTPVPSATPNPATTTATLSATASTTFASVSEGGYSDALILPPASAAVPVTETISSGPPNGVNALSRARRRASDAGTSPTPLAYLNITDTTSISLTGTFSFAFTLPSVSSGAAYNLARYVDGQWYEIPDPNTVNGNTITFSFSSDEVPLSPTQPFVFALFSSAPGPQIVEGTLTFDASSPGAQQIIDFAEPNDTAPFTATIVCAAATPAPTASSSPSPDPSTSPTPDSLAFVAEFNNGSDAISVPARTDADTGITIVGGDQPGTCTVTVTDANNHSATATVNVDETNAGLYSVRRVKH